MSGTRIHHPGRRSAASNTVTSANASRLPASARITFLVAAALLAPGTTKAAGSFHFRELTDTSLALFEGDQPVFVYNHGMLLKPGVPPDRTRGSYVHPLYGLDGEILTDDFPEDHYHHRGLFWAWPHVRVGDRDYDLWALQGIEQRFEEWLVRTADAMGATLGVRNGWFVGDRKVARESVWIHSTPSSREERVLDVELTWEPMGEPLTLRGAEGKSYGGLTLRFAPRTNTVITTPLGHGTKDLTVTRLPWADLSAHFEGRKEASGAAILIAPDHPDFPPEWLTRHYGVLCVGWPGVEAKTFQPGETIHCRYRVWIHRGAASREVLAQEYRAYEAAAPPPRGKNRAAGSTGR
jgi:hypothetical protein